MKTHIHNDQLDGHWHPWCGRGTSAVSSDDFEATPPEQRCAFCDREWFPNGQPEWHLRAAVETATATATVEPTKFYVVYIIGETKNVQLQGPYKWRSAAKKAGSGLFNHQNNPDNYSAMSGQEVLDRKYIVKKIF